MDLFGFLSRAEDNDGEDEFVITPEKVSYMKVSCSNKKGYQMQHRIQTHISRHFLHDEKNNTCIRALKYYNFNSTNQFQILLREIMSMKDCVIAMVKATHALKHHLYNSFFFQLIHLQYNRITIPLPLMHAFFPTMKIYTMAKFTHKYQHIISKLEQQPDLEQIDFRYKHYFDSSMNSYLNGLMFVCRHYLLSLGNEKTLQNTIPVLDADHLLVGQHWIKVTSYSMEEHKTVTRFGNSESNTPFMRCMMMMNYHCLSIGIWINVSELDYIRCKNWNDYYHVYLFVCIQFLLHLKNDCNVPVDDPNISYLLARVYKFQFVVPQEFVCSIFASLLCHMISLVCTTVFRINLSHRSIGNITKVIEFSKSISRMISADDGSFIESIINLLQLKVNQLRSLRKVQWKGSEC